MNLKDEKKAFAILGLEKQKVVEMENERNKLVKEMQKIKNEQALTLMHNKLGQIKGEHLETKKAQVNELEQKIKEGKLQINEKIENIKLSVQNKVIAKMQEYEDRLDTLDENEANAYTELSYKLSQSNNLNYDSLPVFENGDEKDNQRENDNIGGISISEER